MKPPSDRPPEVLSIDAVPHRDVRMRHVGFPLDHPYVELCWVGVIGPSGALLLRRLPDLWAEEMPAQIEVGEFARSLGLGGSTGGWKSRIWRTFDRLRQFGLATPLEDSTVGVYAQVSPVPDRYLARLPEWTQRSHDRLVGAHLDGLAGRPQASLADPIVARLDRMQHQAQPATVPGRSA